ncbi:MAG TPA: hypothetical protein VGI78_00565 [Acetobacteraceae bacterium]|jgi:hypothetical protein
MSIAMTIQAAIQVLRVCVGKAARGNETHDDGPARLPATVDHWIAEEQWLTGFPANRSEQFGWLWYRGP